MSRQPKRFSGGRLRARADCRAPSRLMATSVPSGGAGILANTGAANGLKYGSSKYLNNLIEQDHRSIKLRLGPMLGLKRFRSASIIIAGIDLMHRIRKGQFNLESFASKTRGRQKSGMLFRRMNRVMFRAFRCIDPESLHQNQATQQPALKRSSASGRPPISAGCCKSLAVFDWGITTGCCPMPPRVNARQVFVSLSLARRDVCGSGVIKHRERELASPIS